MLSAHLFTRHQFDSPEKAAELFAHLNAAGPFAPLRFDTKEPIAKRFPPADVAEPVRLLSGQPKFRGGGLFVQGAHYTARFAWNPSRPISWDIYLGEEYFDRPSAADEFVDFVAGLCRKFPPLYGGAAPDEDWKAKHWLVTKTATGESQTKLGLGVGKCLPGVYWLTVFGPPLVKFFGREKIEGLDAHRVLDLKRGGLAVVLRADPFGPDKPARLRHDREAAAHLGPEYFFDIEEPAKECEPVPGVAREGGRKDAGKKEDGKEGGKKDASKRRVKRAKRRAAADDEAGEAPDEFFEQALLSPDGEPYAHPSELAATFVTFTHTEVKEVFEPTESALAALDAYFAAHPQRREYTREHLLREFVPALAGFLGEVLVKDLGGEWVVREPLPRSAVKVGGAEVSPFAAAYRVVFSGAKLTGVYREAAAARPKKPARGPAKRKD